MYDWLVDALRDGGQVITASRRLARELKGEFGQRQIAAGRLAWRSPAIAAWQDWPAQLLANDTAPEALPMRLNSHQDRVLWERCLRREVANPMLNLGLLVRQSREAWRRLREFRVPLASCRQSAIGRDQHAFANAAAAFQSILDRENWIDDAGIADLVVGRLAAGRLEIPERIVLAGFDRLTPQAHALLDALRSAGTHVGEAPAPGWSGKPALRSFDNVDSELRVAGAWARRALETDSGQRLAVVMTNLERDPARFARLLREGLLPGWQSGGEHQRSIVNVSSGRKLSDYPACSVALTLLRWLGGELPSTDISLLLRTSVAGGDDVDARSRLDLRLRRLPNRAWSPAMFLREFGGPDDSDGGWLPRLERFARLREDLPRRDSPSSWARIFDEALTILGWPGPATLGSAEFQLVNRWRELLNEFSRLEILSDMLTFGESLQRLRTMCSEIVFQPEAEGARVQLLGPLEAAGLEFDQIWICGLSSAQWPPPRRPLALLSRQLQRDYGMPDADPKDVLEATRRVLDRLRSSAPAIHCSYSLTDGDAEQIVTALLADVEAISDATPRDPGWFAADLVGSVSTVIPRADPVPAVRPDERVSGGAATLQMQLDEPFSAFAHGRLGVRLMPSFADGLAAAFRGKLIHDALFQLYRDRPDRDSIRAWSDSQLHERIDTALQRAFARHERNADAVLGAVLGLEKNRARTLLDAVVQLDRQREPFAIIGVEASLQATIEGISLRLRADRIDRHEDGQLAVLDYKTGARRKLLGRDGLPRDVQLVVYATALDDPVSDLALFNIDSRGVNIDGAGEVFTPELDWARALADWRGIVATAARDMKRGDVRLREQHSVQAARPLAVLSRVAELRHDG